MKSRLMIRLIPVSAAMVLMAACSSYTPRESTPPTKAVKGTPEVKIGLRRADVMESSEAPPIEAVSEEPGEAPLPTRPFAISPPVIPHSVDGLLPLTAEDNSCLGCHEPEAEADSGATPIPGTHMREGQLDGRRYLCVFCHAPQTRAQPLVANRFQP